MDHDFIGKIEGIHPTDTPHYFSEYHKGDHKMEK